VKRKKNLAKKSNIKDNAEQSAEQTFLQKLILCLFFEKLQQSRSLEQEANQWSLNKLSDSVQ
jgi:hypothetical protein